MYKTRKNIFRRKKTKKGGDLKDFFKRGKDAAISTGHTLNSAMTIGKSNISSLGTLITHPQMAKKQYEVYNTNKENEKMISQMNDVENVEKELEKDCEKVSIENEPKFNKMSDEEQDFYYTLCVDYSANDNVLKLFLEMTTDQRNRVINFYNENKEYLSNFISKVTFDLFTKNELDKNLIDTLSIFLLSLPDDIRKVYLEKYDDPDFDASIITLDYLIDTLGMIDEKKMDKTDNDYDEDEDIIEEKSLGGRKRKSRKRKKKKYIKSRKNSKSKKSLN
jgi:hypothetical protein